MIRARYEAVFHERLLRRLRSPKLVQDLRLPTEVVTSIGHHFDEYPDEVRALEDVGGDVMVRWELARPTYKNLVGVENYGGVYRLGRYVTPSAGPTGIMGWRREFRDSLLAYGYDQFDMVHALPSIVFHYFKDLNLPSLSMAIAQLDQGTSPHRQAVKDVVIRTLQGCDIHHPTSQHLDVMQCEWYDGLVREARRIHQTMEMRYPGFVSLCKAKRRKDGKDEAGWTSTAVQIFYADVESTIQTDIMRKLGNDYSSVKDRILINCDALFIPKTIGLLPEEVVAILDGFYGAAGIKYSHKPMLQIVHIPDIDLAIRRVHGSLPTEAPTDEYGRWKIEFEAVNFYLSSADKFVTINERTRELYYTGWKNMLESRYPMYKEELKKWYTDPDRRTYHRIVNQPPPNVCNVKDFNLWGFKSVFRAATLPELGPDDDMTALVAPVLECFQRIVSGNEDHFEYLMHYMADSLQNPGLKRAQYIGMYGEQGVGKNELMERFWLDKIVGPGLSVTYKSIGEMAEKYETHWHDKMWVMIHEVEYKDFVANYQFIKGVTGSLHQISNTKHGALQSIEFYGRIIMLSNYANAFNEDNLISRRQGLRCVASSFRDVPNALEILDNPKVQRAFYDYLMDYDLEGWDAERDRVDTSALQEANFMTTFRKEQGNMMMVLMHCALDKLYETYRKIDDNASVQPTYLEEFAFPQSAIYDAYYELCNFEADEKRTKNAHLVNMAAMATQLDAGGAKKLIRQGGNQRYPFFKGNNQRRRPGFRANYTLLKNAIQERMDKYNVEDHIDIQYETERIVAKLEAYHQEQLDAGWEYRPSVVVTIGQEPRATKTAHYNKPGETPAYVIKEKGEVIFASDDLEEINKELGEAWVEDREDGQILHHPKTGKQCKLGDTYMRPHGKMMIEKQFPFYIRDRTI